MKSTLLGKVSRVLDVAVFVFTTMAIAGVFYEGMTCYLIRACMIWHAGNSESEIWRYESDGIRANQRKTYCILSGIAA